MRDLLVENLPGDLPGLGKYGPSVLRLGVVTEVGAFVDKSFSVAIDHDAERIGMTLILWRQCEIAEILCVAFPGHGMTTRPVPIGLRAGGESHGQAVAGVEARTANLRQIPARPQIAGAPFGIRLEPAAGQHDGPRMDGFDLARNIRGDQHMHDLPIVMITSRIAEKHREHAKQLGVNHYLGKPYSEEELLSLVRRYCATEIPA